jgi:hypothetical protein
MRISAMDMAKLLAVMEETRVTQAQPQVNSSLQASIDKLTEAISAPKVQAVTAPSSTSVAQGTVRYFTDTRTNYNTQGTLFTTTEPVYFKLFKVETPTEFNNLVLLVNGQTFMQGDFKYFSDVEMAYYNPETQQYVFNLVEELFSDGIKITIDNNIYITLLTVIGKTATSADSLK